MIFLLYQYFNVNHKYFKFLILHHENWSNPLYLKLLKLRNITSLSRKVYNYILLLPGKLLKLPNVDFENVPALKFCRIYFTGINIWVSECAGKL